MKNIDQDIKQSIVSVILDLKPLKKNQTDKYFYFSRPGAARTRSIG